MKNFNWTQFSKRIFINSNIAVVYDAWTKSEELEKWFLSKARFSSHSLGDIPFSQTIPAECNYEWHWFAQSHSEKGVVLDANGKDFLSFTFAGNCKVSIQLKQVKNQTQVVLTQEEIPEDDASKENIRLGCAFGWTFYLLNLNSVLEGGLDLRNKDTELVGVVNN